MSVLRPQRAALLDACRPGDDKRIARTAEMGRHAFRPLERCIAGHGPSRRVAVVMFWPADVFKRHTTDARQALGARSVVAVDIKDKRVVPAGRGARRIDKTS